MSKLVKNYNRRKISFKYGKGSFLYSTDGKKYLDFVQGIAVNSLGHAHPQLVKTINQQSKKLWHVSNAFVIPEGEKLAQKLTKKTFADFVMFQNSGTEATEGAIKVARKYFHSIGKPKKNSDVVDHVLKDFDEEEIKDLKKITTNITESLSILLDKKLELFSSTINNK